MSVIIRNTRHGRRAFPITTEAAEALVKTGGATRLKVAVYRALEGGDKIVSAALQIPPDETDEEDTDPDDAAPDAPRKRGRPRKA